jgi:hypothetical protein
MRFLKNREISDNSEEYEAIGYSKKWVDWL